MLRNARQMAIYIAGMSRNHFPFALRYRRVEHALVNLRCHLADCGSAKRADLWGRELYPRRRKSVVAPSLTPESYNNRYTGSCPKPVVAPSLTPESYNYGVGFVLVD